MLAVCYMTVLQYIYFVQKTYVMLFQDAKLLVSGNFQIVYCPWDICNVLDINN